MICRPSYSHPCSYRPFAPGHAGSGGFGAYAGTSCTNQAITGLNASGTAGCNTITSNYVDSSLLKSANNLSDVPSAAMARTNLGLGPLATQAVPCTVAQGCTGATSADATAANNIGALAQANNLSDLPNPALAQSNLGLGSAATLNTPIPVASGGTGTTQPGGMAGTGLTVSGSFPTQQCSLQSPVTVANGGTQCGAPGSFANLPASPINGEICTVTDAPACIAGIAVSAGGGAVNCQLTYNGTNWMPAGGATANGGLAQLPVHQVRRSSAAQMLSATCDASYPMTEWHFVMNHQFSTPTIIIGGNCAQGQQLIIDVLQDSVGGITPTLRAASGYGLNWQAMGGNQPTITTIPNAQGGLKFQLSTYPSGNNLILWAWLPNTRPVYAVPGTCPAGPVRDGNHAQGSYLWKLNLRLQLTCCTSTDIIKQLTDDSIMKRFLILGMILTYATAAWAQANNANPYSIAGGLYFLGSASSPVVPTPFPNNLTGYTARIYWKNIEPSDGSYTWTQNDNLFSQLPVGKVMALNNLTGVHSLDWALDKYEADGTGSFSSIWSAPYNAPNQNTNNNPNHAIVPCAVFEFPIPWDTTYQHDISNMVTALAGHIATLSNNSALVRIGATPISTEAAEMDLMTSTTATAITCGAGVNNSICGNNPSTCTPPLDTAAWQAVGYTPNKLRAASDAMLSDWTRNFPQVVVSAAMLGG